MLIEVSVILARAKSSILLLDKEERRGLRQLGLSDLTSFKVFINELLACFHLFRVHRVSLGYLWNKSFFQLDSMVKQLLRRKFSISWFIEDFGIFGILWREFLFYLLSSLCQHYGKGEFSDVRVGFSHYSSECGHVSLLGINLGSILGFPPFYCSKIS